MINRLATLALATSLFALTSCTTTHYRESADREVYATIEGKTPDVAGMPEDFTIELPATPPEVEALPANNIIADYLGEEGQKEVGAHILSLEKTLAIAFTYSREYQTAKEALYLQALSLTLERYNFDPIFSGDLSGRYSRTTRDAITPNALGTFLNNSGAVSADIASLTGNPADLFQQSAAVVAAAAAITGANTTQTEIVNERSIAGNSNFGVDYLLKSGGRFALDLTTNLLRFLTGDPREAAASVLSGSFVQPLLRGGGRAVTIENLTQAERNLLYELRDFTRFRKTFAVRIARDYYGVLSARDQVRNAYRGLESARRSVERYEALQAEGRVAASEVGRSRENVRSFESSWVDAIRGYRTILDNLKVTLGLSVAANLILDEHELEALEQRGLIHPTMSEEEAIQIALETRLDLYTQRDTVDDARRRIYVAANALKPGLNLIVDGRINSKAGNRPLSPDWDRAIWSAGLDVDLPFNRKAERNAYRSTLIGYEQAKRNFSLFEDRIRLNIRDALRALEQQKRQYEINREGVESNQRRVDEQELLTELGRGNANNQIDAANDFIAAENNLTNALVRHTIARLEFFQDLGILFIKEDGQWEEII